MIDCSMFVQALEKNGVGFYTGVPDSLLSALSSYLLNFRTEKHITAVNEGNAVALAIGYYLSTGTLPLVYMQNSGIGNAVNPLLSLCAKEVYSIPMLLVIGWRGEPGVKDEPQHAKQGSCTIDLLSAMSIPYEIIRGDDSDWLEKVKRVCATAIRNGIPAALVFAKNSLNSDTKVSFKKTEALLAREEAIEAVLDLMPEQTLYVATTGKTGRELFELREKRGEGQRDFLTVGGMGHASSIAATLSLRSDGRKVVCLDGDGAVQMHMGSLCTIGSMRPENLVHILLNNHVHDSVGGQPTAAPDCDFSSIAKICGYRQVWSDVRTKDELSKIIEETISKKGPSFIEILVKPGARKDLGRPTVTPAENKKSLMKQFE